MTRSIFWLFLFFSLALGQWGRISFGGQEVNVYVFELLIAGYVLWNLRVLSFKKHFLPTPYLVFIGILLISLIWGFWNFDGVQNLVGAMYVGRLVLYGMFGHVLSQSKPDVLFLKETYWIYVVMVVMAGIIQIAFLPNFAPSLFFLGWDNHLARVVGFFFDSTTAGVVYGMLTIFSLNHFSFNSRKTQKILLTLSFLLFIGTFSRISYIGMLGVLVYAFFQKDYRSQSKVGLISFLGLLILLGVCVSKNPLGEGMRLLRTSTISARYESVKKGIEMWIMHPVVGVGYGRIRYVRELDVSDQKIQVQRGISHSSNAFSSSYVTILASSGVVGLCALLFFLKKLWKKANNSQKKLLLFLLVTSLFDNVMLVNIVILSGILTWEVLSSPS